MKTRVALSMGGRGVGPIFVAVVGFSVSSAGLAMLGVAANLAIPLSASAQNRDYCDKDPSSYPCRRARLDEKIESDGCRRAGLSSYHLHPGSSELETFVSKCVYALHHTHTAPGAISRREWKN